MITALSLAACAFAAGPALAEAPSGLDLICPLVEHERQRDLADLLLEGALAENEYDSRSQVFEMVAKLWEVRAVEREIYLDYKRLRDRTKVLAERLRVRVRQQEKIMAQYRLICGEVGGEETTARLAERIAALQRGYREIDCDLLVKDVEIAQIDHAFDVAVLESARKLAESSVKTRFDVVIDEYDASQSKARVDGYRARLKECRRQLAQ